MAAQRVDHTVDVPLLMSHPKSALLGVLQLLKGWESVIEDDITVEQFSGAMTNMVYRCGLLQQGREVQVVLMRVHASSSDLFDRQLEIHTFKGVSRAGLGPRLLLLFNNGRVEEFLSHHVTLAASDIHDPPVSAAIAAALATFHIKMSQVMAPAGQQSGRVQLWERLRLWLDLVQQVTSLSELQQLGMVDLEQEIDRLEQQLTQQHPCWLALCHNDLQYGNIMALVDAADEGANASTATAGAAPPAHTNAGDQSSSSSLTQQLQALGLGSGADAAGSTGNGGAAAAADGPAAGLHSLAPVARGTAESLASDDASLSNVSVAGSTAPSVSGLSVLSAGMGPTPTAPKQVPAAPAHPRVTSLTDATSSSSLQVLGRSPHTTVQLPDGSLVLPGMRARPRGQSPEPLRGKRPDISGGSFTGSLGGTSRGSSGQWVYASQQLDVPIVAAAAGASGGGAAADVGASADGASAAAGESRSGSRLVEQPHLQPPSAAAVLRHASSTEGELLLQLMPDDPEAATEAALLRRHRISQAESAAHPSGSRGSSSGPESDADDDSSSTTTSAADSAEAEDLLIPPHLLAARQQHQQQQQQQQGRGGAGGPGSRASLARDSAGGLAVQAAATTSRSARRYREVRRARLTPAEGLEFPALLNSDPEDGIDSDYSSGLSDDSPDDDNKASDGYCRGRSPPSRYSRPARVAPPAAAAAAAVPGRHAGSPGLRTQSPAFSSSPVAAAITAAGADTGRDCSSCITFIDYEYSGFNPVAFDIANHWCEWAADYHTEQPHVLDFSKLPNQQEQLVFVEAYLQALLTKLGVQLPQATSAAAAAPCAPTNSSRGAAGSDVPLQPTAAAGLAGLKLPGGLNPDSSRRSEAAWSTISTRGGSELSLAETDAGWETASISSLTTTKSNRTDAAGTDGRDDNQSAAAAGAAACRSSSNGKKTQPSSAELQDALGWLEFATDISSCGSRRQLTVGAWQQLVRSVVSAAQAYMAASHLLWALWGIIQAQVSDVDFDFTGYGLQRWKMYKLTRPAAEQQ